MLFGEDDMPPDIELPMLLPDMEPLDLWRWRLLLVAPIVPEVEPDPIALPEPIEP